VVLYPILAYLLTAALLYLRQGDLLFPAPKTFGKMTPAARGIDFEDLQIPVKAGGSMHAWWIPSLSSSNDAIVVFHGNGYVLEDMAGGEVWDLHQIGASLLLVDYRGYGGSTPISPDEVTVTEDAEAALEYILRGRLLDVGHVFVLGRSIGSGPAIHLASSNASLGGVILESPFTSIDDAARAGPWYFRIFPVRLILRTHFDNLSRMQLVRVPVLIISGEMDTLTPPWMAKSLFARAHPPKQLLIVPNAAHNNLSEVGGPSLAKAIQDFVRIQER
jgi:fermentation-respiration switch protein FrsA (DUF1100 family)